MELAKKCPFLARVPASYVRKARGSVLVSYAEKCPVMSEILNTKTDEPKKNEGKWITMVYSFVIALVGKDLRCERL